MMLVVIGLSLHAFVIRPYKAPATPHREGMKS